MNATSKLSGEPAETDLYLEIESLIRKNPKRWQSVCAVLGLGGGAVAPLAAAIFNVFTWFIRSIQVHSYLHVLSIVLCVLTLPLLMLGASCLDLLEANTK